MTCVKARTLLTANGIQEMVFRILDMKIPQFAFDIESSDRVMPNVLSIALPIPIEPTSAYYDLNLETKNPNIVVYVIQLSEVDPNEVPELRVLFQSTDIIKICCDCRQDTTKIESYLDIITRGTIDIQTMERSWGGTEISLESLGQNYLNQGKLDKRMGRRWTDPLSYAQIVYAGVDAYLTLAVYQAMLNTRFGTSVHQIVSFDPIHKRNTFIRDLQEKIGGI